MVKEIKSLLYSGKRISKAGEDLRVFNTLSPEDFKITMDVISFWRQTHEEPVRKALSLISKVVYSVDKSALFARRMKRIPSIYGKLMRYPKMSLYKMNDIGGCRAILKDRETLYTVLRRLKKLPEFKITLEETCKVNDYIEYPKPDGYRSVHIIGKFEDDSGKARFVELQLRTPIQHSWATAVEIVDLFTRQSLKTNQGTPEWAKLFIMLSYHFDVMDKIKGFVGFNAEAQYRFYLKQVKRHFGKSNLLNHESGEYTTFKTCVDCLKELNVVDLFNGFANSLNIVDKEFEAPDADGYVLITCNIEECKVLAQTFPDAELAEKAYVDEEVKYAGDNSVVVAMVSTPKLSELRLAYPNYFADSSVFLSCVLRITDLYKELQTVQFSDNRSSKLIST